MGVGEGEVEGGGHQIERESTLTFALEPLLLFHFHISLLQHNFPLFRNVNGLHLIIHQERVFIQRKMVTAEKLYLERMTSGGRYLWDNGNWGRNSERTVSYCRGEW